MKPQNDKLTFVRLADANVLRTKVKLLYKINPDISGGKEQ